MAHVFSILLGLISAVFSPQEARLDGKASVVQEGGLHIFRVEVATDLPDQAIVEFDLYYLVQEPADDDPKKMVWNERAVLGAIQHTRVSNGKAQVDLARYTSPPYPLIYRIKLEYDPNIQDPEVRDQARAAHKVLRRTELTVGNPEDFKKVVRERKQDYLKDFTAIESLYKDLNTVFLDYWKDPKWSKDRWRTWKETFVSRLDRINGRNDDRMILTVIPFDMKGQAAVDALGKELLSLLGMCSEVLDQKAALKELPVEAQENMRRFKRVFEDDFSAMEFDDVVDLARVNPKLQAVLASVATVDRIAKQWVEGKSFDREAWAKERDQIQGQVMDHLMTLSSDLPKAAMYERLTTLASDASTLLALCDQVFAGSDTKPADEISRLTRSLSTQLKEIIEWVNKPK